jgi:hypothetical protein
MDKDKKKEFVEKAIARNKLKIKISEHNDEKYDARAEVNGAILKTFRDGEDQVLHIINKKEIIKGKEREVKEFILRSNTYLGKSLFRLPYGIVNKNITGIGGTSLESDAERNSIIVEPLIKIASSKAAITQNSLYVGSPTNELPKSVSEYDIKSYHLNSSIKYKKNFVVADSLSKVINAIGVDVYNSYFLVLDEIDSFQCDSN